MRRRLLVEGDVQGHSKNRNASLFQWDALIYMI